MYSEARSHSKLSQDDTIPGECEAPPPLLHHRYLTPLNDAITQSEHQSSSQTTNFMVDSIRFDSYLRRPLPSLFYDRYLLSMILTKA